MKLLLVEDNAELSRWLCRALREELFEVECARDADAAMWRIEDSRYDLVLLDLKLASSDGRSVLRRLRREREPTPVLVLTASEAVDMKVECLNLGADDYVVKPFEVRELVARIRALIRRSANNAVSQLSCGDLSYDLASCSFAVNGEALALTPREHRVLEMLLLQHDQVVGKNQLMAGVFPLGAEAGENAIETYVHRLRRKLAATDIRIITLRGFGYILKMAADET
ncbi:transcriptional regulatory protein tctD [mine drainage metagenome]|jgi:DNA-binding response OmpR family regulator|uniref:Transcriptional regulatory protein tctD n=1 Tax=mine drainage metagenome TaxID=410659 RepID=A0A1J5RBH1_9ZZZZ